MKNPEKQIEEMSFSPTLAREDNRTLADKILCLALDVGENILLCGGEINRVENTIERICRAYGARHVEVFSINSLIVAAMRMEDGSYSNQMRRMTTEGTDLCRLERLNALSRKICTEKTPVDEALQMVKETKKVKPYPVIVSLFGALLGAASFAIYFGGSWLDALAAGLIAFLLIFIERHRPSYINKMANTVICSFIGGMLAYVLSAIGLGNNVDIIMIGTIMLLVPGAYFGYALRDLLFGDLLSGSLKIVQAVLLAAMIALGFSIAIILMGGAVLL